MAEMTSALAAVDAMVDPGQPLLLGRLTQAGVTACVAERLGRGLGIETDARMPRLLSLTRKFLEEPPFRATEPDASGPTPEARGRDRGCGQRGT
jgi:glutathione S-transferase